MFYNSYNCLIINPSLKLKKTDHYYLKEEIIMNQPFPHQKLQQWAQERPNAIYLRQIKNQRFIDFSYQDTVDQAQRLISAYQHFGLQRGDTVAIIAKNCAEWFICDLACMIGGYISVPIFPTAGTETQYHCLTHAQVKLVIIGKLDNNDATKATLSQLPDLITIQLDYPNVLPCQYQYSDLITQFSPCNPQSIPKASDIMSIVYTSGTSGLAKGAILTYEQFAWTTSALIKHIGIQPHDRLFSYLPLAHITERVYILGSSMIGGVTTAFPESLDTFIDDIKLTRPTLFISVPRLWQLFQQRIFDKLPEKKLNLLLKIPFVSSLIKTKLAKGLGLNHARVLGCGSAPVSLSLLQWYEKIGLNITEAWGMTESLAYTTLNYPFRSDKLGSVGQAAPNIELRLADDHEIHIRSKGMFSGYYLDPDATEAAYTKDNWLKTGDLGDIDSEGYLTIKGRKKDTFKTSKGKFVAPVPIEKRFHEHFPLSMSCLIGSGMAAPFLLAVPLEHPEYTDEQYEQSMIAALNSINQTLEPHQKIRGILIVKTVWDIENGILTPTLKLKRHLLEQQYEYLDQLWPDDQPIVWEAKQPLI